MSRPNATLLDLFALKAKEKTKQERSEKLAVWVYVRVYQKLMSGDFNFCNTVEFFKDAPFTRAAFYRYFKDLESVIPEVVDSVQLCDPEQLTIQEYTLIAYWNATHQIAGA